MNKLKKIFHVSDIHIRNVKRHKEYRDVFEKMFAEIRKRGTEDSIIYLAGDIAHAKLEMSPELVSEIVWLFKECVKHCPTILIAGNHDCNMNNADRMDVLTPIVDALKLDNFYYLRDTSIFHYGGVAFGVMSIFDDKTNWPKGDEWAFHDAHTKIALFHGPVDTSITSVGYVVSSRHFTTEMFDGYDLALLGDIHTRQEMISPKGCKVVYAGSLVQQNFGESLNGHGFLCWDLDSRTYEAIDISNDYGYYTLDVDSGKVPVVTDMPKFPRLRVRLSNTDTADTKKVMTEIKLRYGVDDFTLIRTDTLSKSKTGNRVNKLDFEDVSDVNHQNSLINEYIQRMLPFVTDEDLKGLEGINNDVNSRIVHEDVLRNIFWKPIRFEFSNMFSYGEDNKIDFTKLNGLMGLFAPNASGKSSLFDAVSFCLYDKCSRAFKAQNIMNNRKNNFWCELHFQINGEDFYIRREARIINKGKNVKVDVQFWKTEGGQAISLNGTERRDTNNVIEQYVGKYEDFVLTALSLQGNNALFIDKSQSERKDLLAQFMGLNVFDRLFEIASEDIKEVSVLIKNFKKTDFTSELAEKGLELKEKNKLLKGLQKELEDKTEEKENHIKKIVELNKQLTPIDKNLDLSNLESRRESLKTQMEDSEKEFKTKEGKVSEYTKLIGELSESIKECGDMETTYTAYTDKVKEYNKTKQALELLEVRLNSNKEKLSHLEKHEYDPNCKFCMNNVFVKDALKTKEELEKQQTEYNDLETIVNGIKSVINDFGNIETNYKEYNELKQKHIKSKVILEKTQAELEGLETKAELLETQLDNVESDIEKYYENEDTIERNRELEEQIQSVEILKQSAETEIKRISKEIHSVNGSIASLGSFIEGIKEKMSSIKELEERSRLYSYYLDAVSRNGIPYELISKALPVIQTEVNNILAQVVDFGCVMEVDGKNINAKIVYDDQEWPLEMCSGMERFVSGLAIRVALINICNLPRPNFLVIDEGFGTLDADNLSSLFMMMQYLKTQFDFIWIISHLEQMRDIADGLIEIRKEDGFSKIDF